MSGKERQEVFGGCCLRTTQLLLCLAWLVLYQLALQEESLGSGEMLLVAWPHVSWPRSLSVELMQTHLCCLVVGPSLKSLTCAASV